MPVSVSAVEYFYASVPDQPGEAARMLSLMAESGVNLLAFSIVPTGPVMTQLVLFPESPSQLLAASTRARVELTGPHFALLVQGDDNLVALVDIHRRLADADINVYASSGVTDLDGGFGYVLYIRPEQFKKAAKVAGARGASVSTQDLMPARKP